MALNVQIKPDFEDRLSARVHSTGESLEALIHRLLERELTAQSDGNNLPVLTGAQKAEAFRQWAESFPPNMPLLSLGDISREKLYERD
jgi:hypothetical protein